MCAVNQIAQGLGLCQVSIMEGGGEKGARKMSVNAWSDHNDGPLHLPRETKEGQREAKKGGQEKTKKH